MTIVANRQPQRSAVIAREIYDGLRGVGVALDVGQTLAHESIDGKVDGVFTLDEKFDGLSQTKPNGIIYIVSGAGGATLYDSAITNKPDLWKHEPKENWVPYTSKVISNIHSFTVIETEGKKLTLRQLNTQGVVFDEIHVTK